MSFWKTGLVALFGATALAVKPSPTAAMLLHDLEVYFLHAVDLQTALSRFRTSQPREATAVFNATSELKVTIDQLSKDVNGADSFSPSDSTIVADTWLSHLNIDSSYIMWFEWEEPLFKSVGKQDEALSFLKGTNETLATLLPVVRSKVTPRDAVRIATFQDDLTSRVQTAIKAYS